MKWTLGEQLLFGTGRMKLISQVFQHFENGETIRLQSRIRKQDLGFKRQYGGAFAQRFPLGTGNFSFLVSITIWYCKSFTLLTAYYIIIQYTCIAL